MTNTIRAERATIELCDGLSIDAYRMPDGEFRVGVTSASLVAGYAENYLRRLLDQENGTRIKALQDAGFEGKVEILVRETPKGDREARTISLKDFHRFLRFADREGKASAAAILDATFEITLTNQIKNGFGEAPLTIEETRKIFYSTYAASVNWLEEDRNDRNELYGWGD
jgi:hypothetical protein